MGGDMVICTCTLVLVPLLTSTNTPSTKPVSTLPPHSPITGDHPKMVCKMGAKQEWAMILALGIRGRSRLHV